ncbi:hypothetical protein BHE74_00025209 [Ensete ventricosum]|nr:hypothetical protein BHE74_00025209 [Ensete ventricosum]
MSCHCVGSTTISNYGPRIAGKLDQRLGAVSVSGPALSPKEATRPHTSMPGANQRTLEWKAGRGGEEIAMGVAKESRALRKGKSSLYPAPGAVPGGAMAPEVAPVAFTVDGADEDERLRLAGALAREEVLRRRSRRTKQLARCYRRQFWALMEEIRVKHRDYYWEHGSSPFDEGDDGGGKGRAVAGTLDGIEENGRARLGFGEGEGSGRTMTGERMRCAFPGCKSKAMPLTRFCHPHILADGKQKLYKACTYVTKRCGL